jgi:hypothetical protein
MTLGLWVALTHLIWASGVGCEDRQVVLAPDRQAVPVPPLRKATGWTWAVPVVIGLAAFAMRLLSALHSGGLFAVFGYDEGVYFGASTSFVSGLMPYRDFVLVHPPGSVVLLSPFALIGKVTSEPTGWMIARLAIMALGAMNAVLIYVIARRINVVAGIVAGGLYAAWGPVVHVERTTMLEAFVLSAVVVALWALADARAAMSRLVIAGVALGLGASAKLWGLVPLAVILGWLLISKAWRSTAIVAGAAVAALAVVVVPFFVMAPERMYDLVILAQIGRGKGGTLEHDRLARMFGLDIAAVVRDFGTALAVGSVALGVVLLAMGIAWVRAPRSRPWVALLLVQVGILLAVPVYFEGYSSFIGPALTLVCGTAVGVLSAALAGGDALGPRMLRVALIAGVVTIAFFTASRAVLEPVDLKPRHDALATATADAHCVGSDTAGLLIASNVLSRNILRGCPTIVDFDGMVYSFNDGSNPNHLSSTARRLGSSRYQQAMRDYFAANDVLLIHRSKADVFDARTRGVILGRTPLFAQGGLRVLGPPAA